MLLDEYSDHVPLEGEVIAECAEISGLFADPPEPVYENYTLVGCQPAGLLRAAVDGGDTWIGNILVDTVHDPGRLRPPGCDCDTVRCSCMEQLLDVTITGSDDGGTRIGLRGVLERTHRDSPRTPAERPDATRFTLTSTVDGDLGSCADIEGLFIPRPEPAIVPARLLGARLTGRWREGMRVNATLFAYDTHGQPAMTDARIFGDVTEIRDSAWGDGLADVTFACAVRDPMPSGAREIWDMWHAGPPKALNQWASYSAALRHEWMGAALRRQRSADRPAGTEYVLDGEFVTDLQGFYCALGEAINGPGGYFGWNISAFDDCFNGGFGATIPFRLVWNNAAVAQRHLIAGYDHFTWMPAVRMEDLLGMFAEHHVEVELR